MSAPDPVALRVSGLRKAFGPVPVLAGVDLAVPAGTMLAVLGPSGGGKTTLLRLVAGFERADAGTIEVRGRVVEAPGTAVRPERRGVGIVPQEGALFPHLSVGQNVGYGLPRSPARAGRVAECLELVGLPGAERARPNELSGGQQQRVALARALAPEPAVVLLDEPFASLDAALRRRVRAEVCDVLRRAGATSVLVTHDQEEALSAADLVAVLLDGRIRQCGSPVEVYRAPRSLEVAAFVGEAVQLPGAADGATVTCALGTHPVGGSPGIAGRVVVVVRPEQIVVGRGPAGVPARVVGVAYLGPDAVVDVDVASRGARVTARVPATAMPRVGDEVFLGVDGPVLAFPGVPPPGPDT